MQPSSAKAHEACGYAIAPRLYADIAGHGAMRGESSGVTVENHFEWRPQPQSGSLLFSVIFVCLFLEVWNINSAFTYVLQPVWRLPLGWIECTGRSEESEGSQCSFFR